MPLDDEEDIVFFFLEIWLSVLERKVEIEQVYRFKRDNLKK